MHIDQRKPEQTFSTAARFVPPERQRRVAALTLLALLLVAAGFTAYHYVSEAATRAALSAPRPPTAVEVAEARLEKAPDLLSGIGTLQAIHQVTVSPEVGGRVVKLFFDSGAKVKAGDPLVQLYDEPLRADLANFEAQRRMAALNLQRAKDLQAREFQSRQSVEQQQTVMEQAAAGAAKARAQIDQMLIRAPFAGELGVRQAEVGAFLNPGAPIVTLTDSSSLWVNFTLPEQAATQVRVGQPARVRTDAYPDRLFEATISAIEPQISQQTRTLLVQATLPNPDHALLPGMFARVEAVVPNDVTAVVVPETAIDYSLYGEAAYVVVETTDDKGQSVRKVRRVVVKTGQRYDGKVVVTSGLKGGEQVVSAGQLKLNDGATVTILPSDALARAPATNRY